MWNVNPKKMCTRHLLGEHVELHMIVGSLNKGRNLKGHIEKGQLEIHNIKKRHEQLVKEMKSRDFKHNSPLPKFNFKIPKIKTGKINVSANERELAKRCKECKFNK